MNRPSARQRGYSARWERARAAFLREHPLCVYCARLRRTKAATVVDHIIPHRGDKQLFWDQTNWQSLCASPCHSAIKAAEERGHMRGCDADGIPIARPQEGGLSLPAKRLQDQ